MSDARKTIACLYVATVWLSVNSDVGWALAHRSMLVGQAPPYMLQSLDHGIEQMFLYAAPESFAFCRIVKVAAVANHDKIEAGDH